MAVTGAAYDCGEINEVCRRAYVVVLRVKVLPQGRGTLSLVVQKSIR